MARSVSTPDFSPAWHIAQLPPVSRFLVTIALALAQWDTRRRSRLALSRLDKHLMEDIGLNEQACMVEFEKPFWRG